MFSPPCGTWSRANWANDDGPKPCRNRRHPWGIPHQKVVAQRRADSGNAFIHVSIRALLAAQSAKRRGLRIRCVLEHPEYLGRMSQGEPASIWQLPELRAAFGELRLSLLLGGHQCQFPGVDRKKPTRLMSDILVMGDFGKTGWPWFDTRGFYVGPLPHSCGHNHRQRMIGKNAARGFHTSPLRLIPLACVCSSPRGCSRISLKG